MIAAEEILLNAGAASYWGRTGRESSIDDLLSDEIAADLMHADHVMIEDVWRVIVSARRQLQSAGSHKASPAAPNGSTPAERDGALIDRAASFSHASPTECSLRHDQIIGLRAIGGTEVVEVGWMLEHVGLAVEAVPLPVCADLYLNCAQCNERQRCRKWLAAGEVDDGYRLFCPNAPMFDRMCRV